MSRRLEVPDLRGHLDLASFPSPAGSIEHVETHISHLVFAGDHVYKWRKAVDLGFLDFTSPEARRRACEDEVRLNRPLAPGVHLGVVPICRDEAGHLTISGDGEVVEHATHMLRLPRHRMMDVLLDDGEIENEAVERLASCLVRFHADARHGPDVDRWGEISIVRENAEDNFATLSRFVGDAADAGGESLAVCGAAPLTVLERWTRDELNRLEDCLRRRVAEGRIRDGHGDLHAENVCYLDDRPAIYDRIEFSDRFRCCDVAADLAFLAMDLDYRSYRGVSGYLVKRYAELTDDPELRTIMAFYKTYRALVRAKVSALLAHDLRQREGIEAAESARLKAMRYLNLAASYVLPCGLILTCGLPGSGKSVFAHAFGQAFEAVVLRSDRIRKTMFGFRATDRVPETRQEEVYGEDANRRVYETLLARARQALEAGRWVVVDAAFPRAELRRPFQELAKAIGVTPILAEIRCPESVVRARLAARVHDRAEVSDAGVAVYESMQTGLEPPLPEERAIVIDGRARGTEQVACLVEHLARRVFPV